MVWGTFSRVCPGCKGLPGWFGALFFPRLPFWHRGLKLFGQCPYRTNTFQKGASLIYLRQAITTSPNLNFSLFYVTMWQTSACNRCWMSSSSSSGRSAKVRKCCSHVEVPTCTLRWWQWPSLHICEDLWTSAHVDIEIMTSWTPVTICEGLWTSLNIFEHLWTSVTIFDHLWPSVNIFEHLCTSVNNCEHEWSSVNICDHLWTCVNIFEHLWKHKWISVKISEQLWKYVNIC